jgi:hypothetical protein
MIEDSQSLGGPVIVPLQGTKPSGVSIPGMRCATPVYVTGPRWGPYRAREGVVDPSPGPLAAPGPG